MHLTRWRARIAFQDGGSGLDACAGERGRELLTGEEEAYDAGAHIRPNPFLEVIVRSGLVDDSRVPSGGTVVDLGCGGGRDAVWLARRYAAKGVSVCAVDNHQVGSRS